MTWSSKQSAVKKICSFVTIKGPRNPLLKVPGTIVLKPTAWHQSTVDAKKRVVKLLTSFLNNTCTYIFIGNNRFHLKVQGKKGCKFGVREKKVLFIPERNFWNPYSFIQTRNDKIESQGALWKTLHDFYIMLFTFPISQKLLCVFF